MTVTQIITSGGGGLRAVAGNSTPCLELVKSERVAPHAAGIEANRFFAVCDASTTYSVAYHFSKYNSPETGDNGFNTNGYNNGTSFTDWYLPSINELLEMHDVLENTDYAFDHQNQSEKYWLSSTAVNENSIKVIHLPTLQSNSSYIDEPYWRDSPAGDLRIRPIRTHTFD